MMIGAHPDDENTALLAYFARGRHFRTAYLSLTRGEGGQNLIGTEQGDALGIIRTQELLAARRIDGAEQYFTRAIDFGFSKTAEETLMKWPRDKVLADMVWDIRRFRPDVIVLRFSGTPRDGHGQHQVSAILGKEAFSAAADPASYPEQLQWVQPWQAKRLMYNVIASPRSRTEEAQKMADRVELDLGEYDPGARLLLRRNRRHEPQPASQPGHGRARAKRLDRRIIWSPSAGDKATHDIFDGIEITWDRLPGGAPIGARLTQASNAFVPAHPEELLKPLSEARPMIADLKDPLAAQKLKELDETMAIAPL